MTAFRTLSLHFVRKYMPINPHYLCIGHVCHDVFNGKFILGGTASYSALLAAQMGQKTAVLTSAGSDFQFFDTFQHSGIELIKKQATHTTLFENKYQNGDRTQLLHQRAATLYPVDIPKNWQNTAVVLFCPIADEVDFSLLRHFPNSVKGATIQGWLRQWDETGKVTPKPMDWEQLAALDVVIMSNADIAGFEDAIPFIASMVKVLVVTLGKNGAEIYENGNKKLFPAFPVKEQDATGAGDTFATAFLLKYAECGEVKEATAYAHSAASIVVEGVGVYLPQPTQINQRFQQYIERFF